MSTDSPAASWSNLPVPIQPRFDSDELALVIGTCLSDAVFCVDAESGCLVGANERLLLVLGQDVEALEEAQFPFDRLVHSEDRGLFHTWMRDPDLPADRAFQIRLVHSSGSFVPVEVRLKSIRWQRREYRLGFVSECGESQRREARLRGEVEEQKLRSVKALESSLRMYELNEKIKSTLELMALLLRVEDEEQLLEESVRILTDSEGLNFKDATFLVQEGSDLVVARTTKEQKPDRFPLGGDNRYARLLREGLSTVRSGARLGQKSTVIPLRCHDQVLGLVEVSEHQRERDYIEASKPLREWQLDMLEKIGDVVAILLDNLRLKRELERQSSTDALTEAFNRKEFMRRLSAEVQRARRYARPTSLIFLDVDLFKEINDQYGHLQGDQVLRDLGAVFRESLRQADVIGRYGGDEFVLLLPETNAVMAKETADKLIQAVRAHHFANLDDPDQRVPVTISVGVTTLRPGQDEERFLQAADAALYEAKKEGRDQAVHHPGES